MVGANRPGKSDWLVADCSLYAEARHPVVTTPKNAQSFFSVLDFGKLDKVIIPKFRQKLRPGFFEINETTKCITITKGNGKGNKIFFLTQEGGRDGYESFSAHRFYVDEEHKEDVFTAILARCVDKKASILGTMTPEEGLTWFWYKYWLPYRQGKLRDEMFLVECSMFDNPVLDPAEIRKTYERMYAADPLMARIRVYGEPLNLSGSPFFNMEILNTMISNAASVFFEKGELTEV